MKPTKKPVAPPEKEKKAENVVLMTNSVGNGLWCRVKGTPTQDSSKKQKADISEVERKAEKSVIEMLEAKINHLNNELESLSMNKQQLEFDSGIAIKERDIIKQQFSKLTEEHNASKSKFQNAEEQLDMLTQENVEYKEKYEAIHKDNINTHTELSNLKAQYTLLQKQREEEAKKSEEIVNKLQEQLEDYSEQTEKLEEELKNAQDQIIAQAQEQKHIEKTPYKSDIDTKSDISKKLVPPEKKENTDNNSKMAELINEALSLKKKLKNESEARRQMQEHIKLKDASIKQLSDQGKQSTDQIAALKSSLSYAQSQLSQKTADIKLLEGKMKMLQTKITEFEKEKEKEAAKLQRPQNDEQIEDSLELVEVEAQPYLFGPGK
jgi:chromosome segregation ATPase